MRVITKGELYWDGERYRVDESKVESFEYDGPVAHAGGGGSKTNTVTQEIPKYVQSGHSQLLGRANRLAFGDEPMGPETNDLQRDALSQMRQVGGQIPSIVDATWTPAQNSLGYMLDPNNLRVEANPYTMSYADAATRGITSNFTQNVLPNIRGDAISSGQFGGSRQGLAESGAASGYLTSIGDTYAQIANDAYTRQLGAMIAGTQMAPTYANQSLALADAQAQYLANAGNYQQQLDANSANDPWARLDWLKSFYPGSNLGGTTTSKGAAPYMNPWVSTIGGAASGAMLGSQLSWLGGPWGAAIGGLAGYLGSR